jgi:hypothetical protein
MGKRDATKLQRAFGAIALLPARGIANVHARASNRQTMGKRKASPPDKVTWPQPPPKPNFGMHIGPHGEMNTQPEEVGVRRDPAMAEIMHLQNIAWEAIGTATVDGTKRARYWHAWTMHCQLYKSVVGRQPSDQDTTDRLLTFAVTMWEGKYGLGNQVKVQSVKRALRHVAQSSFWTDILTQDAPPQHSIPSTSQLRG